MSLTAALSAVGGAGAAAVPAPDDDFGAALALLGGGADVRLGDCVPILDDPLSGSFTELYGFVDKRFPPTDERGDLQIRARSAYWRMLWLPGGPAVRWAKFSAVKLLDAVVHRPLLHM